MEQRDTEHNNAPSNGHNVTGQRENDFYEKHSALSIIVKKTEKITTAIYMVTDFIADSEPLRIQLRTLALSLASATRKLSARSSEPHYAFADETIRTIDETVSFITLASTIGLVSEMNAKILRTELEKVKGGIEEHFGAKKVFVTTHPGYANVILSQSFFDVPKVDVVLPVFDKGQEFNKGQTDSINVLNKNEYTPQVKRESFSNKNELGIKIARRNDVLNVVRSKGKVSIKDVVLILKNTSEKTVQRELLALVREGVLVKEGEKRWSMYRIAS